MQFSWAISYVCHCGYRDKSVANPKRRCPSSPPHSPYRPPRAQQKDELERKVERLHKEYLEMKRKHVCAIMPPSVSQELCLGVSPPPPPPRSELAQLCVVARESSIRPRSRPGTEHLTFSSPSWSMKGFAEPRDFWTHHTLYTSEPNRPWGMAYCRPRRRQ